MIKDLFCRLLLIIIWGSVLDVKAQNSKPVTIDVQVYITSKYEPLRLSKSTNLLMTESREPAEKENTIIIDPQIKFQTIVGIGGALTDAAAEVFYKLPKNKQQELLTAYFDPDKGIGYNWGRSNIQSCDFSSESYSYVTENDTLLKSFSISHDLKYRVPFIKEIIKATNGKLLLFVSPWSPPAWMKTNNDMLHGGKVKPECAQSWANMYVKFINAYQSEGIPIWGLTVQNEPLAGPRWESCTYTAEEQRDFIKSYLGPTLVHAGLSDKKLLAWDHNRDLIYQQASAILEDKEAAKYVWGIGYHWYEIWTGTKMLFDNEKKVSEAFPDKKLVFTEGCAERFDRAKLYDWALGEKYGQSMINDFNNNTVAWTDWNILLDEKGGPNHVNNFCFSPVHADIPTGALIYTNAYYYIGQFSKFVKREAKRISCSLTTDKLLSTAFINPDGQVVVIVMNSSDEQLNYNLYLKGKATAVISHPHSIATFLIDNYSN